MSCHTDQTLTKTANGKDISLFVDSSVLERSPHAKLECIRCHQGFNPEEMPHKAHITPVSCVACHPNAAAKHSIHRRILAAAGKNIDPTCKQCHGMHNVVPLTPTREREREARVRDPFPASRCGSCHSDIEKAFLASAHGEGLARKMEGIPDCVYCHSRDITKASGESDTAQLKLAQARMCVECHIRSNPSTKDIYQPDFIAAYETSTHGMALKHGNGNAANCVNCHGAHEMKRIGDPTSHVDRQHILTTCGQCHGDIERAFEESIHGTAFKAGNKDVPVCVDCHGEHKILGPGDANSPVAAANVSEKVCAKCHESIRLIEKYGLAQDRGKSYFSSFHGLVTKSGTTGVANCASCHGVHDILPSSDTRSMVHKQNLAKTCGKCHPGANEKFSVGSVHLTSEDREGRLIHLISIGYIILIILTISGMLFHNGLDFLRKLIDTYKIRHGRAHEPQIEHRVYLRMSVAERIQHGLLVVNFFVLVFTGFLLKFPEVWWAVSIQTVIPSIFEIRGVIHRASAVMMVLVSIVHIFYVIGSRRGRKFIVDMAPRWHDLTDAWRLFTFNIGLRRDRPEFGWFTYIEKFEYWALIWGTIVMTVTGFILWFDNTFIGAFGKLYWDIARVVHYYEAWLAFLAILIWHFYFVIFNLDVYPMSFAWLTGQITEKEMHEHHALELKRLKENPPERPDE